MFEGARVRLAGLAAKPELNGRTGACGSFDERSGRFVVRLDGAGSGDGIKVRPDNLELAADPTGSLQPQLRQSTPRGAEGGSQGSLQRRPGQLAVRICGMLPQAAVLTENDVADASRWRRCPVPAMMGVPLAVRTVPPRPREDARPSNECMGVYLLIDPVSGFAPAEVLTRGLGPVLVARTDGQPFSLDDMASPRSGPAHPYAFV